jgi:hypothetical protein
MPVIAAPKLSPHEMYQKYREEAAARRRNSIQFEITELNQLRRKAIQKAREDAKENLRMLESTIKGEHTILLHTLLRSQSPTPKEEEQEPTRLAEEEAPDEAQEEVLDNIASIHTSEPDAELPDLPYRTAPECDEPVIEVACTSEGHRHHEVYERQGSTVYDSEPPTQILVNHDTIKSSDSPEKPIIFSGFAFSRGVGGSGVDDKVATVAPSLHASESSPWSGALDDPTMLESLLGKRVGDGESAGGDGRGKRPRCSL